MLAFSRVVFVFILCLLFSFVFSIDVSTSGIRKIEYQVKWCNPVFGCKTGYFSSTIIGPNYTDGFMESAGWKVICSNGCSVSSSLKNIFSNLKLKGEGVYTITLRAYDNTKWGKIKLCNGGLSSKVFKGDAPGNCSEVELVYKIDKTHPNILSFNSVSTSYPNIEENSKTLYIGRSIKQAVSFDYDANTNISPGSETLIRGDINSIQDNPFQEQGIRKNLRTIYFNPINFNTDQLTFRIRFYDYFTSIQDDKCPLGYSWQNVPGYGEGCYQILDADSENCNWNENSIVKNMYLKWGRCGDTNGLNFWKNYLQDHGEIAFYQAFKEAYKHDCSLVGVNITSYTETEKIKECITLAHRKFWSQCNNGEYLLKTNFCKYNPNFISSNENNYYSSRLSKVELYDSSHNLLKIIKDSINLFEFNFDYKSAIKDLLSSQENKVYFIRVRDNAGNYSETPFYVVKDSKVPITLNEFLDTFEFSNGEKIFYTMDKEGPQVNGENSIASKFFAANDNLTISFGISDKKLGSDNTKNSGLLKFKLRVENSNICDSYSDYILTPSDDLDQENQTTISQTWNINHNFSKVDNNCLQDSNKTYRYYRAHIVSIDDDGNEYVDKICDKVGNCTTIAPLVFRVVANKLDLLNSKVKISTQDNTNGKILANGKDGYVFMFTLKDKFGNKIVPVYSQEDNTEVKSSKLTISLYNKLFLNQIYLSDGYGSFKSSLETDEKNSIDGTLEESFLIKEKPTSSPNGIYQFKIYSVVPTKNLYPWLNSGSYLKITNINFESKDLTNGNITKNNDIGQFDVDKFNGSLSQGPVLSTGNLKYSGVNKYISVDYNNYGKVLSNNLSSDKSFQSVGSKQIKLDFASPILTAFGDLKSIVEGVKNIYSYNIWNFDKNTIIGENVQLYEKWITNTFYDFYLGTGNTEYKTRSIGIAGSNLLNLSKNLSLISSLSNNLNNISKFTKISIQPLLSDLVDPNDNHIAVATKLAYKINNNLVILPSDGKGIGNTNGNKFTDNDEFGDSLKILTDNISISNSDIYDDNEINPILKNIKILGQVASRGNEKQLTNEDRKRNIGGDIKKWKIRNNVLKKVGILSKSIKKWCNNLTLSKFNNVSSDCVVKKGNELIAFIEGNVTIDNYEINGFETIVVKDGNVYIKGNIYKTKKNSLLAISVLNSEGFERKNLSYDDIFQNPLNGVKGFVYINPAVTNIDAYIFAHGSILSYDGNKIYDGSTTTDSLTDKNIYNQLYIRGGIISTNTIGGSRLVGNNSVKYDNKCPWFLKENDCSVNVAQAFDLIYLRRYTLTNAKIYGGPDGKLVPYIPVSITPDITSYNIYHPYMGGRKYCELSNNSVDCNKDDNPDLVNIPKNGEEYPLYIEFDPTIQSHTPFIFTP